MNISKASFVQIASWRNWWRNGAGAVQLVREKFALE